MSVVTPQIHASLQKELERLRSELAATREQLSRRERELAAVYQITAALHAQTSLDDLERQTLKTAIRTVDAAAGSILLYDPKKERLVFKYVVNDDPAVVEMLMKIELLPGQGLCGSVYQEGTGRITLDATREKSHEGSVDKRTRFQTQNMVTVPLKTTDGQTMGVMQILNKRVGIFDENDLAVLETLAIHAASAIETARLHEQARLAVVVNLIGDISHDVKNLITPMIGSIQTLELIMDSTFEDVDSAVRESQSKEELAGRVTRAMQEVRSFFPEAMEMTGDSAQAVQERVREIADAIKGIVAEPHFELAAINEVAEAVAKPLRGLAEKEGVAIDLTGLGETPPAEIDKKRMYNALYNLINNAIPETPSGGTISVRTRPVTVDGEERLEVVVADTGRGMPEHVRAHLFTDHVVSTKPGGTGLGTRIVKNVVDAHHGTIAVESHEGQGTQFIIRIPLRQPRPGE
jgi:signal transduction histidine kinase